MLAESVWNVEKAGTDSTAAFYRLHGQPMTSSSRCFWLYYSERAEVAVAVKKIASAIRNAIRDHYQVRLVSLTVYIWTMLSAASVPLAVAIIGRRSVKLEGYLKNLNTRLLPV